ncbi:hypothetical protein CLU85_0916 [Acidovorax sp. 69]|nr:hypothetical protein CLU85_0916 [Acidovorax sp. 69]
MFLRWFELRWTLPISSEGLRDFRCENAQTDRAHDQPMSEASASAVFAGSRRGDCAVLSTGKDLYPERIQVGTMLMPGCLWALLRLLRVTGRVAAAGFLFPVLFP